MFTLVTKFQKFEEYISLRFYSFLMPQEKLIKRLIKSFFVIVSKLGDGYVYLISIILLSLFSSYGFFILEIFAIGFTIERIFYFSIKNLTRRNRPYEQLQLKVIYLYPPDRYSFPSGHTSSAFLFATILSKFHPEFYLILYIFAILVGISRIILNLHYLTDVLVGSQIGIFIAVILMDIIKIS